MAGGQIVNDFATDNFSTEKRFHFINEARLLVTIPNSNDRLVLRKLDFEESMHSQNLDYLYVTSPPNVAAKAGVPLNYQLQARSSKGGTKFALSQGPPGLTASPDGKIIWNNPRQLEDEEMKTIVTVSDSSGQEQFFKFRLIVR